MGAKIGAEVKKAERQVIFPNGGEVSVRSADNPDSLRGEGLNLGVLDEIAYMQEEAWSEAIRPALSDKQGKAIFISTPKGRNWFWRLWQKGLGDDPDWRSWQRPTSDNPFILPKEIEDAKKDLPELTFEQEYLAVFLENEGAVFRNITACLNAPETNYSEHNKHKIVVGIDWGKQNDFTAISFGCINCHTEVARDRFNKIDYAFQRGRIQSMAKTWYPSLILAESNAMGIPIIEQLQREGMPVVGFDTTPTSKPPLIESLALCLDRAEWQFQKDPIWTGELEAYERKVSPVTGRSQYSAPEGLHDDTVIARALMIQASLSSAIMIEKQPEQKSKWIPESEKVEVNRWRQY